MPGHRHDSARPLRRGAGDKEVAARRALDEIRAAAQQEDPSVPTVADLAAHADVSARTLRRQFAHATGQSPRAIGRQMRLAAARETLCANAVRTVLDAALRHGFDHPGRFSRAYAKAFGEKPLATLRRARANLPPGTPHPLPDVDVRIARAGPGAHPAQPGAVAVALDMLNDALHRDPAHAHAQARAAWCRVRNAIHDLSPGAAGERAPPRAPGAPAVPAIAGAVSALAGNLGEAARPARRALAPDAAPPIGRGRLGWILVLRGRGSQAVSAFRETWRQRPLGTPEGGCLIGFGVACFGLADHPAAACTQTRALDLQPSLAWAHRFLAAAAMHAGGVAAGHRSPGALRAPFPDLTAGRCSRATILDCEAVARVLEALFHAGLPCG